MRASHLHRRSVLGRTARAVVVVLLVVAGVAAALTGGAIALLRTEWGSEQARRFALPRLNAALAGEVEVARFRFGGDRVRLEELAVRDPEGDVVARARRVEIWFSPLALLSRRVHLRQVEIDAPELDLRRSDEGLNLARAFASARPAEKSAARDGDARPDEEPGRAKVALDALAIRDGAITYRDEAAGESAREEGKARFANARVSGLRLDGRGRFDGGDGSFATKVTMVARAEEPLAAPLSLDLDAEGVLRQAPASQPAPGSPQLTGSLRAEVGDSHLEVASALGDPGKLSVHLRALVIRPETVRALLPAYPLRATVDARGAGAWDDASRVASGDLAIRAGGADVTVQASVDLERSTLRGLTVRGRSIDLARLFANAPPSRFGFDLEAHGSGRDPASARGALTLEVPRGELGGRSFGPIRLRGDADRGRYRIADLLLRLPGLRVTAAGAAAREAVALKGKIALTDFGALMASLGVAGGQGGAGPDAADQRHGSARPRPRATARRPVNDGVASGSGELTVAVTGRLDQPALAISGTIASLRWRDLRLTGLSLDGRAPNLVEPHRFDLAMRLPALTTSGRSFRDLAVTVRGSGDRFDMTAEVATPDPLSITANGAWSRARAGAGETTLLMHGLSIGTPDERFALAQPARLTFGAGAIEVKGLVLASGQQRLSVDFAQTGADSRATLRATLAVRELDLARLPRALVPRDLKLGGRLDADVTVRGRTDRPAVTARLALDDGRIREVRDVQVALDARLVAGRASGQVSASALGAALDGRFDVPVPFRPGDRRRIAADVALRDLDLGRVFQQIERLAATTTPPPEAAKASDAAGGKKPLWERKLAGRASATLRLAGTAADPEVDLAADVRELAVAKTRLGNVALRASANARGLRVRADVDPARPASSARQAEPKSTARATATAPVTAVGPSFVEITTDVSPGRLQRLIAEEKSASGLELLQRVPLELRASVDHLPLGPWAELAGYPQPVGGVASFRAELKARALDLRGDVSLELAGVRSGRFPSTDAVLAASFDARDVDAKLKVSRKLTTLFDADVRLGAPTERLARAVTGGASARAALATVPIRVRATLGPLELQRLGLPPQTDRDPPRAMRGRALADVWVDGTLGTPRALVKLDASHIRLDKELVGAAKAEVSYDAGTARADVQLMSANGGRMRLRGSAGVALGYPQITRGFDTRQIPIEASLEARGFDVSGFSGVVGPLRLIRGQLVASGRITGTAADPRVSGRLEWNQGRVAITGMGEYRNIHLALSGDAQNLTLEELVAESGGGRARITGKGVHQASGGYRITLASDVRNFPVYMQGQALATVTVEAKADTRVSPRGVDARVSVDEARVELTDEKRKNVQSLARPADVVLTDDGEPLNRAQAAKLAALRAEMAAEEAREADARTAADRSVAERPPPVHIKVDAERNVWVRGKDAFVELGLDPGFQIAIGDKPRAFGRVLVRRGRLEVMGRRFDLQNSSSLRFTGPVDAPELDVTAQHENEKENITVVLTVKGPPDRLQVRVSAPQRPELSETELYTLIVTGRLQLGATSTGSTTPTSKAASLLGGLVAAQLQKALSKKLPFDVISIEPGEGLSGTRLEAGTYLTDDLYVSYVRRTAVDPARLLNRNAVHLEYQLTRRWSFEGEYGDARTGSADLVWTKVY